MSRSSVAVGVVLLTLFGWSVAVEMSCTADGSCTETKTCSVWVATSGKGATDVWCNALCRAAGRCDEGHPHPDHCQCMSYGSEELLEEPNAAPPGASGATGSTGALLADVKKDPEVGYKRVVVKGPIHSRCQLARFPGFMSFYQSFGQLYPDIEFKPFILPPHLLLYKGTSVTRHDGRVTPSLAAPERVDLHTASADEIQQILKQKGLRRLHERQGGEALSIGGGDECSDLAAEAVVGSGAV